MEYFDSRKAKQARDSLDNRSIFGDNLRIIPRHAIDEILAPAFGDRDAAAPSASTQAAVTTTMSPISGRTSQPSDRKSTRLNSSHSGESRMPSSA